MKSKEESQFKRLKSFTKLLVAILVVVNITFLFLMYNGGVRYNISRGIAEANDIYTKVLLRQTSSKRDFAASAIVLSKQLDFTQSLSSGNNQLLSRLLNNIEYSFNSTMDENDRDHFEPLLRRMVTLYPDIYSLRVWYAETLQNNNMREDLFKNIDEGIKLIGADPSIYRIGIHAAFEYDDMERLELYCQEYNLNQFGGMSRKSAPTYVNRIPADGLRYLTMQIENGNDRVLVQHAGLNLSPVTNYEFLLPKKFDIEKSIKLYLPVLPGLKLNLNSISFFSSGKEEKRYGKEEILFKARYAFVDNDNSIIITQRHGNEIIEIFLKSRKAAIDKIVLNAGFSKLGTSSQNICEAGNVLE